MNTNNVYFANVYRLIETKTYGNNIFNYGISLESSFVRDTIVYQRSNGKFYDLLAKKNLDCSFDYFSELGTEIVNVKKLVPFNNVISNDKENLSKRKIKKLYIEHKNNGNIVVTKI